MIRNFKDFHNFKKAKNFPGIDIEYDFDLIDDIDGVSRYSISKLSSGYLIKVYNDEDDLFKFIFFLKPIKHAHINKKFCLKNFQDKSHIVKGGGDIRYSPHEEFDRFEDLIQFISDEINTKNETFKRI